MWLLLLGLCLIGTCAGYPQSEYEFDSSMFEQMTEKREDGGVNWALLVAGSNTWDNYRHQADICHAYQILKKHGLPDERIVVMMYDDIAHNKANPTPGIVINHPNGDDVYHGVPKDYTKRAVTPENFLNVLQGKEELMRGVGSGKVIKSGPNDHVFVYFADHGAPGLVAFPYSELKATPLMKALTSMHEEKKYKQLVFYMEACESGSMFAKLPKNINVYATTAANANESSYACYFDEKRDTYLGDTYSVKWMEDSDKENLNMETLHKQYEIVKKETTQSHVQQFGTMSIAKETVSQFQGNKKSPPKYYTAAPLNEVPSPEVKLAILYSQLDSAKDATSRKHVLSSIKGELKLRGRIEGTMKSIISLVTRDSKETSRFMSIHHDLNNYQCYEPLVDLFSQECYRLSQYEYALRQLYALVNLCEEGISQDVISTAINTICDGTH